MNNAMELLQGGQTTRDIWIGNSPQSVDNIDAAIAKRLLGHEVDLLVFNAYSGLDADALGACSGTVVGGGAFVLLTPPLRSWPDYDDPEHKRIIVEPYKAGDVPGNFIRRLAGNIRNDDSVLCIEQGQADAKSRITELCNQLGQHNAKHEITTTRDQQSAITAIKRVATGHRRRPLVITSDRGRGKTSALGIAAAELLLQGFGDICITAVSRDAIEPLFKHARAMLPECQLHNDDIHYQASRLYYLTPQELLAREVSTRLLLVDEAAAIPAAILEKLLRRFSRIVFATTVHGYEGTGRGFAVRFNKTLDRITPQWRAIELKQAIRWSDGDPLEAFVFRALLLNARPADGNEIKSSTPGEVQFRQVSRQQLMSDEDMLSQLFGLLVSAHYRTRPQDLRCLLDCFDLDVLILQQQQHVIGVVLLTYEGMLNEALAHNICSGKRWPHGHLLPEALTAHCGFIDASTQKCARIMRIAIHPAIQGKGFGSVLIKHAIDHARQMRCDYIGASFGVSPELLRFWLRHEYVPARLSLAASVSSGSQSVMLIKGLSDAGLALERAAHARFVRNFPHELASSFRELDAEVVYQLLRSQQPGLIETIESADVADLEAFADGHRIYEAAEAAIWRIVVNGFEQGSIDNMSVVDRLLLVSLVLQRHTMAETATITGLSGKRELVNRLRQLTGRLVHQARAD